MGMGDSRTRSHVCVYGLCGVGVWNSDKVVAVLGTSAAALLAVHFYFYSCFVPVSRFVSLLAYSVLWWS